jgi:hypothetical protein
MVPRPPVMDAAHHHGRDHFEFQADPGVAGDLLEAHRVQSGGESGEGAGEGEDAEDHVLRVDSGQARRVGIRAGGVDGASRGEMAEAPRRYGGDAAAAPMVSHSLAAWGRPNQWKPGGRFCTQAPCVTQRRPSRRATMAARVTTIEGIRTHATSAPLMAPSNAPVRVRR